MMSITQFFMSIIMFFFGWMMPSQPQEQPPEFVQPEETPNYSDVVLGDTGVTEEENILKPGDIIANEAGVTVTLQATRGNQAELSITMDSTSTSTVYVLYGDTMQQVKNGTVLTLSIELITEIGIIVI